MGFSSGAHHKKESYAKAYGNDNPVSSNIRLEYSLYRDGKLEHYAAINRNISTRNSNPGVTNIIGLEFCCLDSEYQGAVFRRALRYTMGFGFFHTQEFCSWRAKCLLSKPGAQRNFNHKPRIPKSLNHSRLDAKVSHRVCSSAFKIQRQAGQYSLVGCSRKLNLVQ